MLVTEKNALTIEIEDLTKRFGNQRESLLPILRKFN
jgi:hypothetical protein